MNDADRKLLTEYLGERWRDKTVEDVFEWEENRDFTTRNDMMDLYEAIAKKGKWWEFVDYAGNQDTEHSVTEFETTFQIFASMASWLFCLNGQGYEERCQMVADWIKEASHEST